MDSILYKLGVSVALEAPGLATAAAMAIAAFEKIQKAAQGAGAGATQAQAQLDRASRAMRTMLIGGAITAGGVFGVDIIKGWVEASSEMTTVLAKLAVTTHASRAEMDDLESSFTRLTRTSQLSTIQIAGVAQAAAGAGLTNAKQLLATLPALVTYADVLQRTRGIGPEVSVPAAVKMENLFGIQPGSPRFNALLNAIGEASKIAGSPQALMGQLRQAGPTLVNMGIPPEQVIPFLAVQAQLGLGASGGARGGLAAILRGLIPNLQFAGAKPSAQGAALSEIQRLGGGRIFDKAGVFAGLDRMLEIFARAAQQVNNPLIAQRLFATALGKQGGQLGLLLSNPAVMQRTRALQQQIGTGSMLQDQRVLLQTPGAQWTILKDTLHSIAEIMGDELIPSVLKVVSALAQAAGAIASFLQSHKDVARFVAVFVEFATAAALVIGPVILAAGAFDMLAIAGGTLGLTLMGTMPWLAAIAVAIGAVVLVVTHWHQVTEMLGPVLKALGATFAPLGTALGGLWTAFRHLWDAMQPLIELFGNSVFGQFSGAMKGMPGVLGRPIALLSSLVGWMTSLVDMTTQAVTWLDKIIDPAKNAATALSPLQAQVKAIADALGAMVGWLLQLAKISLPNIPVIGQFLAAVGLVPNTSNAAQAAAALKAMQAAKTAPPPTPAPPHTGPLPHMGKGGGAPFGQFVPLALPATTVPAHMVDAHVVAHAVVAAHKVAALPAHLVPLHPPAHVASHMATPRHAPPPHAPPMTVHVGGITVHSAPHEHPETLAKRVQASVEAGITKALAHHTRYDGSGHGGLEPASWGY